MALPVTAGPNIFLRGGGGSRGPGLCTHELRVGGKSGQEIHQLVVGDGMGLAKLLGEFVDACR